MLTFASSEIWYSVIDIELYIEWETFIWQKTWGTSRSFQESCCWEKKTVATKLSV